MSTYDATTVEKAARAFYEGCGWDWDEVAPEDKRACIAEFVPVLDATAADIARQAVTEALGPVRALADEWEREFANFRLDQPIHLALHAALAAAEGVDR